MNVIEIRSLTRCYGSRRGVDDLSLGVPEGVLFGFLGPNGAGKTTTIRVLLGFLRANAGSARVLGLDAWRDSKRIKAEAGYVPGDLRLYPWLNGLEALRLVGAVRRRELMKAGREMGEFFELDLKVRVRAMSRGMRQKLGLIMAMAHRPRLLVLDEPSSGLDPLMQDRLHEHLRRTAGEGTTVFFSSHSLSEVERLCDRVAIVKEGRLVADEPLESLRRRAGRDVVIRWKQGASAAHRGEAAGAVPAFLALRNRDAVSWEGIMEGPVSRLLEWLEPGAVEDLSIGPPDLESLFRRFYERDAPGAQGVPHAPSDPAGGGA